MPTIGTTGNDIITPSFLSPNVTGTLPSDGADNINGGGGADFIAGGGGIDIITGDGGNDTVLGGEGDDDLQGNTGNDLLSGGEGGDRLRGGAGIDTLLGEDGNDSLEGDVGDDVLVGGLGQDLLSGGGNNDRFVFTSVDDTGAAFSQRDHISSFVSGDDTIDLRPIDANVNLAGDQAFNPVLLAAFGGIAGQLTSTTFGGDRILRGDVDGDGSADFAIVLNGTPPLVIGDVLV